MTARAETRAAAARPFTEAQLGMILFLAAEAMFLGALASSLVLLRTGAEPVWPPAHTVLPSGADLFTVYAAVLLAMVAHSAARRGGRAWWGAALAATVPPAACAAAACARMAALDQFPDRHNLFALHWLLGGLFILHAAGAAAWAAWHAARGATPGGSEGFALFAHFLAAWAMAQYVLVYWS